MLDSESSHSIDKSFNRALGYCCRLLATREYAQVQLQQKLRQKGVERTIIEQVIKVLVEEGWQSDKRFAESFVRSRLAKGQGELRIRHELQQLLTDKSLIDEALAEQNVDWLQQCEMVVARRLIGKHAPLDWQEKQKLLRFLTYRGFPSQLGNRVIAQWEQKHTT